MNAWLSLLVAASLSVGCLEIDPTECTDSSCTSTPAAPAGPTCTSMNSCLSVDEWLRNSNYCTTTDTGEVDVIPVLHNGCNMKIRCKVCGNFNGVPGDCEIGEFNAGQSIGGWATQYTWCDADGLTKYCSLATEDYACVENAK